MSDKITLFTISDMPLVASGVASQTKYMIEGLLKTGKYKVISLGGAIKHDQYNPVRLNEYGEDWTIFPIDGYGNPDVVRQFLDYEKINAFFFMTDPRFFRVVV